MFFIQFPQECTVFQIQADAANKKYAGPVDCVKQLYREGGIRSIYRGTAATLLRGACLKLPFIELIWTLCNIAVLCLCVQSNFIAYIIWKYISVKRSSSYWSYSSYVSLFMLVCMYTGKISPKTGLIELYKKD